MPHVAGRDCEAKERGEGFEVKTVITVRRLGEKAPKHEWVEGRDVWFDEAIKEEKPECVSSER